MGDRCTGHCCRAFTLPKSPEDIRKMVEEDRLNDGPFILDMLIYLGLFDVNPAGGVLDEPWHYFTCRHLDTATGNCTVYEQRPHLCRNYPNDKACEFPGCTWDAVRPSPLGPPDVMMKELRRKARYKSVPSYCIAG